MGWGCGKGVGQKNATQPKPPPLSSRPPGAPPPTDAQLAAERDRLLAAVGRLEAQLADARTRADADASAAAARRASAAAADASRNRGAPDEAEVWASHLVVLQDTLRMHREEVGAAEVELAGRARLAAAAADRAAAEVAGRAAAARTRSQLLATEARLDRLKMELYFPKVKGYMFAVGGKGIYFGGKDVVVSEATGPIAFCVAPGDGADGSSATLEIRAGRCAGDALASWGAPPSSDATSAAPSPARGGGGPGSRSGAPSPVRGGGGGVAARPPSPCPSPRPPPRTDDADAAIRAASASPAKAAALAAAPAAPTAPATGLPPLPPGSAAAAAARAADGARGRAVAARFLSRIGSARSMERYARRAAQPAGPKEAWPGAEDDDPTAAADAPPRAPQKSLAARLLGSRLGRDKRGKAMPRGASFGSVLGRGGDDGGVVHSTAAADVVAAAAESAAFAAGPGVDDGALDDDDDAASAAPSFGDLASSSDDERREGSLRPPPPPDAGHLGTAPSADVAPFAPAPAPSARHAAPPSATSDARSSAGGEGRPSSRRALRVVVRLSDVALVGERGSSCPSLSVAELSIELEMSGYLGCRYVRGEGWRQMGRPTIDVHSVRRAVRGASVPVPRALLRLIVGAVLSPVFSRLLLGALPSEIGEYAADAGPAARVAVGGDLALVGPALSSLDARLCARPPPPGTRDAASAARAAAAAAEARGALGLTEDGADVLDTLLGGGGGGGDGNAPTAPPLALTRTPAPATLATLTSLRARYARHPRLWDHVTAAWDAAAKSVAAARGVPPPPPLDVVTAAAAAGLALKPVRASLVLTHVDAGCNVDAAVAHVRAYFERQARELSVKAGASDRGGDAPAPAPAGAPGLPATLAALEAWHAFVAGRLAAFKASFRGASARVVAGVDARGARVGAEAARYVGPMKLRLPVTLRPGSTPDDGWSFDIPLPDPTSYALRRFVDALRSAACAPAVRTRGPRAPPPPPAPTASGSALAWFAEGAGSATGGAHGAATRLGAVAVDGARVRVRLDETAIAELLGAVGPSGDAFDVPAAGAVRLARTAAGVLAALGDVARVSFAPAARSVSSDGAPQFVLVAESAAAASLHADVAGLAFATADGVTPGRLVRLAQGLARAALLAAVDAAPPRDSVDGSCTPAASSPPLPPATADAVATLDSRFEVAHSVLGRDALDASVCLDARAAVEGGALTLRVAGATGDDAPPPLAVCNDVDLMTLFSAKPVDADED